MRMRAACGGGSLTCSAREAHSLRVSVIVPVLNEEARIEEQLDALASVSGLHEVIVVDGGSTDRTLDIVRANRRVKLLEARRGRAAQMNAGAELATGDVLLFLHADVRLPGDTVHWIGIALGGPEIVGGAFRTWTVAESRRRWLSPLLHLADLRSRYTSLPYGDQAPFVRASVFRQLGGFPNQPLMEDLELTPAATRRRPAAHGACLGSRIRKALPRQARVLHAAREHLSVALPPGDAAGRPRESVRRSALRKPKGNMADRARIEGLSGAGAPLWVRLFQALQKRRYGVVLEPTRVWARAPAAMRGFLHLAAAVDRRDSPIEPGLRSLVTVKVSQLNSCSFCIDLNASRLQERGVSMDKALALANYETSDLFSEKERAALDYAVAITRTGPGVDDELFGRVRGLFDDDAIVELTALIALQNASSKFNAALGIPSQGFCPAMSREGQ